MTIDIHQPLHEICRLLGLDPDCVRRLDIRPRLVIAELYLKDDSGSKYLGPDGEPVGTVEAFKIIT